MASLKNVNWGGALIGAGLVVGILALSAAPAAVLASGVTGVSMLAALATQTGIGTGYIAAAAGIAGGAVGHKVAGLFHRVQDSATTLVGR